MPDIRLPALAALATAAVVAVPQFVAIDTASAATTFGQRTLKRGMAGRDVRTAQVLLRRVGSELSIDDSFGPATERAVRRFERAAGLEVDGRIEPTEAPRLRQEADKAVAARREAAATRTTAADAPPADSPDGAAPYDGAGGASADTPVPGVPGAKAVVNADGTATAPAGAPQAVQDIIAAGNQIATKPYKYGGGHGKWEDSGYDCSGSVSYALHAAGLLDESMPSGSFTSWGAAGKGQWVTTYANGGHMYMVVAGIRFDTSGADPSRWQKDMRSSAGYTIRHPEGL